MYRNTELTIKFSSNLNINDIHQALAKALEFPEFYGANWDAFNDCINDDKLSNPPETLIIKGWDHFINKYPIDAKTFTSTISKRNDTKKPMTVFVSPRSCPCCNNLTLSDWIESSYEICSICGWEDDPVQSKNPTLRGGANTKSLDEAKKYWNKKSHKS